MLRIPRNIEEKFTEKISGKITDEKLRIYNIKEQHLRLIACCHIEVIESSINITSLLIVL